MEIRGESHRTEGNDFVRNNSHVGRMHPHSDSSNLTVFFQKYKGKILNEIICFPQEKMVHFGLKPSGGIFRPQIYEMQLKFKPLDSFGLAVKGRHSTKVTVNNKANKHTIKQTFGRVDKCSNIPCGPSIRTRVDCRC